MQLDQTRIAIRERSMLDILDMSLRVFAVFAGPLLLCIAIVAIPLMLINWWLVGWIAVAGDVPQANARYMWNIFALVSIQAPLISFLVTPLLGYAMFMEDYSAAKIWATIRKSSIALFLIQIVLRGIGFSWLFAYFIPRQEDTFSGWEVFLVFLFLYTGLVRSLRPFINEIILLERNPLRGKGNSEMTIGRRSSALHAPNSADLISRFLGSGSIALCLSASFIATGWFFWGMLLFDWTFGTFMLHIVYPGSLWLVAGYFAVVRFLCYLDLRIRREGWEVELIMRAAANTMFGSAIR